jgi:D-alanyl-lipoteichoic acid acyltransferase DltB (MBOAT superfamily)
MHGVVSTTVTYLICLLAPRKQVHIYVFMWAMGYMTLSHLYRMTFFYMVDQFDFTRTQMVLTMKLTSFAFNLYDGYCSSEKKSKEKAVSRSTTNDINIKNVAPDGTVKSDMNSSTKSSANGSANGGAVDDVSSNNGSRTTSDSSNKPISSSGATYLQRITAVRARYEILDLPSPLEFGGYVFCFPNLLAGPAFVYQDYMRGIDPRSKQKVVEKVVQKREKTAENGNGNRKGYENGESNGIVPEKESGLQSEHSMLREQGEQQQQLSCALPALHRLLVGVCSLLVFFLISSQAPIARQYDPIWQSSHSFIYRLCFISISFLGERFKFYFAWKVSEGACIMGGFGYEGSEGGDSEKEGGDNKGGDRRGVEGRGTVDLTQNGADRIAQHSDSQTGLLGVKKTLSPTPALSLFGVFEKHIVTGWRGVENIDIITYETGTNIQSLSRAWNKRTQNWLEQYVYQRTNRSLLCTYAVSALWHGLYPGFFIFFFAAALMSSIERLIRVKVNPLVLADPRSTEYHTKSAGVVRVVYSVICWLVTTVTLTYHAQTFYMRSFERSVGAFRSFYFVPNILFILVYFILEFAPTPPKFLNDKETKKNS